MSLESIRIPVRGFFVSPDNGVFECANSHLQVYACERSGLWAWIMHIFGRNVRVDTIDGAIYVPLAEAHRIVQALSPRREVNEGIGHAFARVLKASIDVASRGKKALIEPMRAAQDTDARAFSVAAQGAASATQRILDTTLEAGQPSDVPPADQDERVAALARYRQALSADPFEPIPAEYEEDHDFFISRLSGVRLGKELRRFERLLKLDPELEIPVEFRQCPHFIEAQRFAKEYNEIVAEILRRAREKIAEGSEASIAEGVQILKKSSDGGCLEALEELALDCEKGLCVSIGLQRGDAERLYRQAFDHGSVIAVFRLAEFFEREGNIAERDRFLRMCSMLELPTINGYEGAINRRAPLRLID